MTFPLGGQAHNPNFLSDFPLSFATMATERKAVIKNADMSEDMQQDAVDCASQALEKYNIEKDIAAFIKKVRCPLRCAAACALFVWMRNHLHRSLSVVPRRSSTRSTRPPGTASLAATSALT